MDNFKPGITEELADVSFYDAEDSSIIIEGVAGMHVAMLPNVGQQVTITAAFSHNMERGWSKRQGSDSQLLPFEGIVSDIEMGYHLDGEDTKQHPPCRWIVTAKVYVRRIQGLLTTLNKLAHEKVQEPPPA